MSTPPDDHVIIGHVARAHGIKGEVVVVFYSDDSSRFGAGTSLWANGMELRVERARPVKDGVIVAFAGVIDRNEAEGLKGTQLLLAKADRRALDDDEFWPEDLVGLEVVDEQGGRIGEVVAVEVETAQPRLVVDSDGTRVEVPFVDAWVPEVRVDDGQIVIGDFQALAHPD